MHDCTHGRHKCGNTGYWGYGNEYQKDDNLEAYKAVVGNGISFIDTSEVGLCRLSSSAKAHVLMSVGIRCVQLNHLSLFHFQAVEAVQVPGTQSQPQ